MDNPPPLLPVVPPSSDEKVLAILCHLSALIGVGLILPLVVYLVKKQEGGAIVAHAKETLNFHLSLIIYGLCAVPLVFVFVGIPLIFLIAIGSLVLAIVAAVKASEGVLYRYPLCIRFIS